MTATVGGGVGRGLGRADTGGVGDDLGGSGGRGRRVESRPHGFDWKE
jgi:hypothetical protein